MNTNTMSDRLRWARESAGLSRRGLSLLAGLDESHVRLIEDGKRDNPTKETLVPLVDALGISLDWLVRGIGDPPIVGEVIAAVEAARAAQATDDAPPALTGTDG